MQNSPLNYGKIKQNNSAVQIAIYRGIGIGGAAALGSLVLTERVRHLFYSPSQKIGFFAADFCQPPQNEGAKSSNETAR